MAGWLQDDERRRTALCGTILLGLLLLFYYRLWWPGLILIKRDAFRFFAPIKQYIAERLLVGDLPQWFPYESLGRSLIGSTVTGVFHPFTALYLALPAYDALRLSTLLACLMGGLGAFVLGRILRFSRAGAMVAGLAFACSGYVVSTTEAIEYLYGICALPFFCAALGKAVEEGPAWMVVPAAIWATVFLGGDIQTGYYYGLIALLWAMVCTAAPPLQAFVRTASVGILAGLLAGVQLAPSWAAFLASPRTDPVLFHEIALSWSMHPLRVLTMIASPVANEGNQLDVAHFFFGGDALDQPLPGLLTDSLYVGVPVIGLAILGAWYRRDLRGLAWLSLVAFWLALGRYGGLYEVFYHVVPLWSAFRYPEKLMGVVSFAGAMLAGAGVDELRNRRGHPLVWFAFAGLCVGLGVVFRTETLAAVCAVNFVAPITVTREVTDSLAQAFLFSSVAASGVGIVGIAMDRSRIAGTVLVGILVAVIMLDLSRANQEAYYTGPTEIATVAPGLVAALRSDSGTEGAGHFRILSNEIDYVPTRFRESLGAMATSSLVLRQALYTELNAEFHIESINVYMPGQRVEIANLSSTVGRGLWENAYARYNTAYFIGFREFLVTPPFSRKVVAVLPSYQLVLVKNPIAPKPRAYLSEHPQSSTARMDLSTLMARPDFLDGTTDFIETSDGPLPGSTRNGRVSIEKYEPEEVRILVESPTSAVLILLDAFEDGWRASLENGEDLPIRRANAPLRAVTVPAGTHTVTFSYQTPLLIAGAGLTGLGLLVCAGLAGWRRRRVPNGARFDTLPTPFV